MTEFLWCRCENGAPLLDPGCPVHALPELWYRTGNTFVKLDEFNIDASLELLDEAADRGLNYGVLCTKRDTDITDIQAGGKEQWPLFLTQAYAWLNAHAKYRDPTRAVVNAIDHERRVKERRVQAHDHEQLEEAIKQASDMIATTFDPCAQLPWTFHLTDLLAEKRRRLRKDPP